MDQAGEVSKDQRSSKTRELGNGSWIVEVRNGMEKRGRLPDLHPRT
jgi:hypothetical protein